MILETLLNALQSNPGARGAATVKVYNDNGDVIDDILSVSRDEDGIIYIHYTTA